MCTQSEQRRAERVVVKKKVVHLFTRGSDDRRESVTFFWGGHLEICNTSEKMTVARDGEAGSGPKGGGGAQPDLV